MRSNGGISVIAASFEFTAEWLIIMEIDCRCAHTQVRTFLLNKATIAPRYTLTDALTDNLRDDATTRQSPPPPPPRAKIASGVQISGVETSCRERETPVIYRDY